MGQITKIKIFPSIGIMRVGNSPDEYFIGPEIPGQYKLPEGGFKDAQCRVKRQAARFRLYGYDDEGSKPIEIAAQNAEEITWTVQLANKKASSECIFRNFGVEPQYRNEWYKEVFDKENNGGLPNDFSMLDIFSIRPSKRSLTWKNKPLTGEKQPPVKFDDGMFFNTIPVLLGEMLTDELGRLVVLGGLGKASGIVPVGDVKGFPQITRTYNTPGWYDDIADGPVTASVKLKNGQTFSETEIVPAWVISAPPDYVPQIENITTLYDVLRQVALDMAAKKNWPEEMIKALKIPDVPSFARDVQPILQRVLDLRWVNQAANFADYKHAPTFSAAASPNSDPTARQTIFGRLRPPGPNQPSDTIKTMPLVYDDDENTINGRTILTPTQYEIMKRWADSNWVDPQVQSPPPFENPEDLTRAALQACLGGALYPGIEVGRFLRDVCDYTEPFRINHDFIMPDGIKIEAGDVTKSMANPWQADFFMCRALVSEVNPYNHTYAWWPAQRPDEVFRDIDSEKLVLWPGGDEEDTYSILSIGKGEGREEMTQKWHQLGFVVKVGDKFVETERTSVCADLSLILDRSHFSKNEVPDTFENCFYVVLEGFTPEELLIEDEKIPAAALKMIAPIITFTRADDNSPTQGMLYSVQEVLFEIKPFDAKKRQRLTFVYKIEFTNTSDFKDIGYRTIKLTATKQDPKLNFTYSAAGELLLFEQPNPYMQDGAVSWLSEDVRVFKVLEGGELPGIPFGTLEEDTEEAGAQSAIAFIKKVVNEFNKDQSNLKNHPFEQLEKDQAKSALELAVKTKTDDDDGKRVFNFAVARVRYRGNVPATDVRVFFRLFTTAATGLDYQEETTYRRRQDNNPVALLGLQGGNIVSIPCYADPRANAEADQTDSLNIKTIPATDKGDRYCYFGCWLDFNQTTPRLVNPLNPSEKKSIQDQIRGLHQCLVAEIFVQTDTIPDGATPASSENLAQRNLLIVESPNPGTPPSRLVQHTFEIKATHNTTAFTAAAAVGGAFLSPSSQNASPDELMIRWNNLPRSSYVTLYLPGVDSEVMRLAEKNYEARRLERLDAHTIRCLPADVTYIPLPTGRTENIPALLTIELPEGIRRGDEFNVVVHQVSGLPRRILGAFQLTIPVSDKNVLLEQEEHRLSVLRHIFRSIPVGDRWHPVFVRYLEQIAGRVNEFGGDAESVFASPDGSGSSKTARRCALFGWLTSLALALVIIVAGLHPSANYLPEIIAAVLWLVLVALWLIKCKPSACRIIVACLVGLAIGSAILAILLLAGLAQQHGLITLACAALFFGAMTLAGIFSGCLSFVDKQKI
ncbi:MAG TPA: LodA/GoxA family CTQ-dependent oxidase [Pyrinomonadaceae bacterium]